MSGFKGNSNPSLTYSAHKSSTTNHNMSDSTIKTYSTHAHTHARTLAHTFTQRYVSVWENKSTVTKTRQ